MSESLCTDSKKWEKLHRKLIDNQSQVLRLHRENKVLKSSLSFEKQAHGKTKEILNCTTKTENVDYDSAEDL